MFPFIFRKCPGDLFPFGRIDLRKISVGIKGFMNQGEIKPGCVWQKLPVNRSTSDHEILPVIITMAEGFID